MRRQTKRIRGRGGEAQEGGGIGAQMADALCPAAETSNTVKQSYSDNEA